MVAIDRPLRLVHPPVVEFGRARASAVGALSLQDLAHGSQAVRSAL
ncbi:hypothetical protein RA307_05425 [Xanthobacteraceae bacterium Astr-EGSB]|nr:hypothetical protein [Xanthobacteraceae bacterium Astr-EGSB]